VATIRLLLYNARNSLLREIEQSPGCFETPQIEAAAVTQA
jgi:hypothetical protein